jgi:predicted Zn-dependent protease with MMP-like domain
MAKTPRSLARKARHQRLHRAVARVVDGLPANIQELLGGVAIVVEDEPSHAYLEDAGLGAEDELFGLYQGVPLTERGSSYSLVIPDRIISFAGPLERAFGSRRDFDEQIRITVLHELGHHLGFDEWGLDTIGLS